MVLIYYLSFLRVLCQCSRGPFQLLLWDAHLLKQVAHNFLRILYKVLVQSDGAEDAPVLQEAEEAPDIVQGEVLVPGQPRGVDCDAVVSENG